MKEINAEILACANGFSTHEDSALRLNGSDFDSNIERLAREAEMMADLKQSGVPMQEKDEEDNNDQEQEE